MKNLFLLPKVTFLIKAIRMILFFMPEIKNTCNEIAHCIYKLTGKNSVGLSEAHNEMFSDLPDLQYVYPFQFSSLCPPLFLKLV